MVPTRGLAPRLFEVPLLLREIVRGDQRQLLRDDDVEVGGRHVLDDRLLEPAAGGVAGALEPKPAG